MRRQTSFPHRCPVFAKIRLFACALAVFCGAAVGLHAATLTVTTTSDTGPGSLRDALASVADGDTIDASGVSGTILLTNGELLVTNSVTILGPGPTNLALNGNFPNTTNRVFRVSSNVVVAISSLTITNGQPSGGSGGGIFNDRSTLTVSNYTISGNHGIGIFNKGGSGSATLTVANCIISGNSTSKVFGPGGGICNNGGSSGRATLIIVNSVLSGNSSSDEGGGIDNSGGFPGTGIVTVANSTLSGNSASYYGGGIGNSAGSGRATLIVTNCTLSGNSAGYGGGNIFTVGGSGNATVKFGTTILKSGSGGNIFNYASTVTSLGYNLSSDSGGGFLTATGDQINTDPKLGPLKDNGGPTFTHALLPGSPAIDAGDPNFTSPPDFDQRGAGFPRVVNGRIDIGAFEVIPDLLVTAAERIGNDLRLTFSVALLDKNYEIQTRTNLTLGTWESLPGSIPGNGGTLQNTITNAFSTPQQFFRVHQLP